MVTRCKPRGFTRQDCQDSTLHSMDCLRSFILTPALAVMWVEGQLRWHKCGSKIWAFPLPWKIWNQIFITIKYALEIMVSYWMAAGARITLTQKTLPMCYSIRTHCKTVAVTPTLNWTLFSK